MIRIAVAGEKSKQSCLLYFAVSEIVVT